MPQPFRPIPPGPSHDRRPRGHPAALPHPGRPARGARRTLQACRGQAGRGAAPRHPHRRHHGAGRRGRSAVRPPARPEAAVVARARGSRRIDLPAAARARHRRRLYARRDDRGRGGCRDRPDVRRRAACGRSRPLRARGALGRRTHGPRPPACTARRRASSGWGGSARPIARRCAGLGMDVAWTGPRPKPDLPWPMLPTCARWRNARTC